MIRAFWDVVIWGTVARMIRKVGGDHHHGDPLGGCADCDRGKADRWQ